MMDTESKAWREMVLEQFEKPLTRYARSILGDLDRARDAVQETFLQLCQQDRRQIESYLAEWLFTVCRYRALDRQRQDRRWAQLDEISVEREAEESDPARQAEQLDEWQKALRLIEMLPPNQREVVRLKFQNGLAYAEISRITGLSVGHVGFLLHTALKTLRRKLKAYSNQCQ